ncbi:hypothetical protein ERJ75_000047400 [Trypanosoma vivax]|nr:hypothetical protein TRVL_08863 [Trypanosoma vivax]KAH8620700.1 hypothetical protein ERJ75_000047400 [Trypanosoma vivax]
MGGKFSSSQQLDERGESPLTPTEKRTLDADIGSVLLDGKKAPDNVLLNDFLSVLFPDGKIATQKNVCIREFVKNPESYVDDEKMLTKALGPEECIRLGLYYGVLSRLWGNGITTLRQWV